MPSTYGEPNGILRPAPKRDGLRECERGPTGRPSGKRSASTNWAPRAHHPIMPDDVSPFADFLDQRRKEIIAEWLRRVRRDRKIPSADDLPREELLDHLPYLLDTLIKQLRGTPVDQVNSQSHGEIRWKQQYSSGRIAARDFRPAKGID